MVWEMISPTFHSACNAACPCQYGPHGDGRCTTRTPLVNLVGRFLLMTVRRSRRDPQQRCALMVVSASLNVSTMEWQLIGPVWTKSPPGRPACNRIILLPFALPFQFRCTARGKLPAYHAHINVTTCDLAEPRMGFIWVTPVHKTRSRIKTISRVRNVVVFIKNGQTETFRYHSHFLSHSGKSNMSLLGYEEESERSLDVMIRGEEMMTGYANRVDLKGVRETAEMATGKQKKEITSARKLF